MYTPYYERTLDSFPDSIITKCTTSVSRNGYYNAVLDTGPDRYVSDPDFSPYGYGRTRQEAIRKCAAAIRADARGEGKFAPHGCLVGYDFHWRLAKHWVRKESIMNLRRLISEFEAIERLGVTEVVSSGEIIGVYIEGATAEFSRRVGVGVQVIDPHSEGPVVWRTLNINGKSVPCWQSAWETPPSEPAPYCSRFLSEEEIQQLQKEARDAEVSSQ